MTLKILAEGISNVGQKRDSNQDCYLISPKVGLFVIADGMGGHKGGETASKLAVDTLNQVFSQRLDIEPEERLIDSYKRASVRIYEKAREDINLKGMGTTLTTAFFHNNCLYIAHVGDSRLYLIREGMYWQLTEDHSLVSEQKKLGTLTDEEPEEYKLKSIITRSVGYEKEVKTDVFTKEVEKGDYYLLCSDGLSNLVKNEEIFKIISSQPTKKALKSLVNLANQRGGDDNITVIIIAVEDI